MPTADALHENVHGTDARVCSSLESIAAKSIPLYAANDFVRLHLMQQWEQHARKRYVLLKIMFGGVCDLVISRKCLRMCPSMVAAYL